MEKSKTKKYFLVDNGSLRPESVLYIRDIAHQLSKVSGKKVEPAGIMHSHKVDPLKLNRIPGLSMEAFFQSMDSNELECINFIPMFILSFDSRSFLILLIISLLDLKDLL